MVELANGMIQGITGAPDSKMHALFLSAFVAGWNPDGKDENGVKALILTCIDMVLGLDGLQTGLQTIKLHNVVQRKIRKKLTSDSRA